LQTLLIRFFERVAFSKNLINYFSKRIKKASLQDERTIFLQPNVFTPNDAISSMLGFSKTDKMDLSNLRKFMSQSFLKNATVSTGENVTGAIHPGTHGHPPANLLPRRLLPVYVLNLSIYL
jgi:hypothetical protein